MFPRHLAPAIQEALIDTKVVVLNGARQSGKSTLVQSAGIVGKRRYLTLDDAVTLNAARADPSGFIAGLKGPVTIDEVQRAPELFLAIKAIVDREPTAGRFLLTGSANVLMLPGIADSLAGRIEILSLWPLSCQERAGDTHNNVADALVTGDITSKKITKGDFAELASQVVSGGFPDAVARIKASRRAVWFDHYVQTILQRDVRELANIEQLTEVPNLLQLLASRSASLLNFAEVSRACGLPQSTLKRYFALLEMLYLVVRVPSWERNLAKRLVKTPKVFIPDTGLLCHLTGQTQAGLLAKENFTGRAIETFVLAELLKHIAFSSLGLTLWHYRTLNNIEVDFLIEDRKGQLTGIEVKASATVDIKDFKGLLHLRETEAKKFSNGYVLYAGHEVIPFGDKLWAVPLKIWC